MLKLSGSVRANRILPLLLMIGLAGSLLWTASAGAERFQKRGVSIPDAVDVVSLGGTRLERTGDGAELLLPLDAEKSWHLLRRVLENLNVKPLEQDTQDRQLLTDWILWVWDPDSESGRSEPPLRALTRTYERHRFALSVYPDAAGTGAIIRISDRARQREVDITPDSEYTWLQWQDAAVQPEAAWSFLRRLQGNFESALSSRLVSPTVAAPRIVEPLAQPATAVDETKPSDSVPAPPTPVVVPAAPSAAAPSPVQSPDGAVAGEQKATAGRPTAPVSGAASGDAADGATSPAMPAAAPLAVQGGLLVDGGVDATWQALLRAIDALGVTLENSDPVQHMLTTQWVNGRYDRKNQQFTLESKTGSRWALDFRGKGRERHRFQLILIPVDGGARTMIYAYHTGFQVETDRTPDSSRTLLYWKDHKTDPAAALAFLRRLRIVVGH